MPFCPSGHESPAYAQFCTTCGTPLASEQAASTPLMASPAPTETPPASAAWYSSPPESASAPTNATPAPTPTSWGAPQAGAYQPAAQPPPVQQSPAHQPAAYQPAAYQPAVQPPPVQPPPAYQPTGAPSGTGPAAPAAVVNPSYLPAVQPPYGAPAGVAPPFRFQIRRLSVIDQVTAVASLLLFVALWMPWFSVGDDTYRVTIGGINAHSWLSFALVTCLVLIGYLTARAGWDRMPVKLPIAHAPLLLVVGLIQLLIVVIAVLATPDGFGHAAGSWIALVAALGASVPILIPVVRSGTNR